MAHRIRLRKAKKSDVPLFYGHQADPAHPPFTGIMPRSHDEFFEHWTKILRDPDVLIRTILCDDVIAGFTVSFNRVGFREVGYWLGQEFWGKGIATEAMQQFLPLIDERPLFARTAKKNVASIRVLEKCGFVVTSEAEGFVDMEGTPIEGVHMRLDA